MSDLTIGNARELLKTAKCETVFEENLNEHDWGTIANFITFPSMPDIEIVYQASYNYPSYTPSSGTVSHDHGFSEWDGDHKIRIVDNDGEPVFFNGNCDISWISTLIEEEFTDLMDFDLSIIPDDPILEIDLIDGEPRIKIEIESAMDLVFCGELIAESAYSEKTNMDNEETGNWSHAKIYRTRSKFICEYDDGFRDRMDCYTGCGCDNKSDVEEFFGNEEFIGDLSESLMEQIETR